MLFDNSDFAILQTSEYLKTTNNDKEKAFCRTSIRAIRQSRKNDLCKSLETWQSITNDTTYSNTERSIANIKSWQVEQELFPLKKTKIENKIQSEYEMLGDQLSLLIYQSQKVEKTDKAKIENELFQEFSTLGYNALSKYVQIMVTGHVDHKTRVDTSNAYNKASKAFKEIGANDSSHHALAMYHLSLIEQDNPVKALELVQNAASEFKSGYAIKMYHWVSANYYNRLANMKNNIRTKVICYKKAADHLALTNENRDHLIALANYHYNKSKLSKNRPEELFELERAAENFEKSGNKVEFAKMQGLFHLRTATFKKNLSESVNHFKKASAFFKKSGNIKAYHHMLGLYNYALHATTSDVNLKVRYLVSASRNYKIAEITEGYHRARALSYAFQAHHISKDLRRMKNLYKQAADEFKLAKWSTEYHNAMGFYYYVSALLATKESIPLFLKSASHFQKVNNSLAFDAAGQACLMIAMLTRLQQDAEKAMMLFAKSKNDDMLYASKMLLFEIRAENEMDEKKKREYYLQSAINLNEFNNRRMQRGNRPIAGLPKEYAIPFLNEKMNAQYEHYMGLAKIGDEQQQHFRKSEEYYQNIMSKDDDRVMVHSYALLLRDWKKYDESYTLFKKLSGKYPDSKTIRKEFELAENLLKTDYKRTKEDLQMEKEARRELLQEHMSALLKIPKSTPSEGSFLDAILAGICKIGIDLETKAPTYSQFSEEEIRDIFHTNLDIATGGRATRESFRKKGHTDIHITNPDQASETIVIEFKFWEGEGYYHKGIGQLLDYTTTRDKHCIFVTLNKKHNWKNIVDKANLAAKSYSQYVSNSLQDSKLGAVDTAFWTEYDDCERTEALKVCHILFNINAK